MVGKKLRPVLHDLREHVSSKDSSMSMHAPGQSEAIVYVTCCYAISLSADLSSVQLTTCSSLERYEHICMHRSTGNIVPNIG